MIAEMGKNPREALVKWKRRLISSPHYIERMQAPTVVAPMGK
jgi:hypothetical protein